MLSERDQERVAQAFRICHGCGKAIQLKGESLFLEENDLFVIHAQCVRKLPRLLSKTFHLTHIDDVIDLDGILLKLGY